MNKIHSLLPRNLYYYGEQTRRNAEQNLSMIVANLMVSVLIQSVVEFYPKYLSVVSFSLVSGDR